MSNRLHFQFLFVKSALCLFLLFGAQTAFSQESKTYLDLVFMGDIMQHSPQINSAYNPSTDTYDYSSCFRYIAPSIRQADIAIANLEVTLAGKPFSGYPTFSSPDELAVAAKNAGIDVLVTSNNHSLDRRKKGLERTIDVLDSLNIPHTGTFKNEEQRKKTYPLIMERKGMKLALLNYTYGTNGIPVTAPNVVNYIDTAQIKIDARKAKEQGADFTIAFFHWGFEYQPLPNEEQKMLVKFSKRIGIDMVIGAHPHVLQPMQFEDGYFAVYSLGNFVSNQRDRYKDGGAMAWATLEFDEKSREVKVVNAAYQLIWVYKKPGVGKSEYYILPADDYLSKSFIESAEDKEKMQLFVEDSRKLFAQHNRGSISEYKYVVTSMPSFDFEGERFPWPGISRSKNSHSIVRKSVRRLEEPVALVKGERNQSKTVAKSAVKNTVYRIQFFVSSGELEKSELTGKHFEKVYTETVNGLTRYLTGDFQTRDAAEKELEALRSETRFKDAYVVERQTD